MTRQVPWLRLASEGTIIVVSILLAFGIDAWWDDLQDQTEESQILAGLETEFEGVLAELENRRTQNEGSIQALTAFLEFGEGRSDWPEAEAFDSLFMNGVLLAPSWDPASGVRGAVESSGRLELIGNPELRHALAAWPAIVEDTREGELEIRTLVRESIVPYLASEGYRLGRAVETLVRGWNAPTLSESQALHEYRRLVAYTRLRALLEFRLGWQLSTQEEYDVAWEAGTEILELIRTSLEN